PVIMAAALPLFFGWVMTSAPARRARVPVSSLDPSSTTMTMSAPGIRLAAVTVAPMRSASFIAGMMAATASGAGFGCALMRSPVRRVRRPGQGHGALRDSARRRASRGCQWMVSWRHDARADAAGLGAHRLGGVQRLVHALAECGDGLFDVVDRGAELEFPDRDDDAVGA